MSATTDPVDVLVIGGGINGVGIACDAAGRGLTVMLCEQGDLASATSSASSKLIHGGLRYLEHYEFRLVRESLAEREILLAKAPHIIRPLRFVLPHQNKQRPVWLIRLGLFLYDHLAHHPRLPNSEGITLQGHPWGEPLKNDTSKGFVYSDCRVDDARLVVLNAVMAAEKGARILTHTKVNGAVREGGHWAVRIEDRLSGDEKTVYARTLVNAGGPWVQDVINRTEGVNPKQRIRLVKGSHIVVPRLHEGDQAYILQHNDGRVVFVLPFESVFSLIGTTEVQSSGDPSLVRPSGEEVSYLCDAVTAYFKASISPADVVWSYCGVRPLFDDAADNASAVTRDYVLDLDHGGAGAPLLSVFGGKITTYRRLAEEALKRLAPFLPPTRPWTRDAPLPGGDMPDGDFDAFQRELWAMYPGIDGKVLTDLAHRHGTRARDILKDASAMSDLGPHFGGTLYGCEVDHLVAREWAETADDILWRRTKVGLHIDHGSVADLTAYLEKMKRDGTRAAS